jgi:hypothetical protein
MGAGPVPEVLHRMLNCLSWLVRFRLIPSLLPLAPVFHFATNTVRWGAHRGGMFVSVEGENNDGQQIERSWHLLAEGNDGPFIPSMAIEAIIRRIQKGAAPSSGARSAMNDLELEDYLALFRNKSIDTGVREQPGSATDMPLYRRLLGNAWEVLPAPIRAMHDGRREWMAQGQATVERGTGRLSRFIARLFSFPAEGKEIPVQVLFRADDGNETWLRTFNGKSFSSIQSAGSGKSERLLVEKFGPFIFGLALVFEDEKLKLIMRRWSLWKISLPTFLAPGGNSYESVEDGRFCFNVEIDHPLTGLIVHYRGRLNLVANAAA